MCTCWLSWVDIQGQSYWLTFLFDFLSKILLLKITDLLSPICRKWDPNFSTFLLMILALDFISKSSLDKIYSEVIYPFENHLKRVICMPFFFSIYPSFFLFFLSFLFSNSGYKSLLNHIILGGGLPTFVDFFSVVSFES